MHGTRLSPTQPARLAFGLVSVLALLALAFPIVAQATPASGVQYSDAPPTATGDNPPKKRQSQAKSSQAGGATAPDTEAAGGSAGSDSSGPGSSGQGSSSTKEADASAGNRDGGTGQGSRGAGPGEKQSSQPQVLNQAGTPATEQDDDGSSPLIPILIAILVLAAISVAALMIRQRRQGGTGTSVSPKAS
jgi:cobalamin biosynthesis Mg chelatase CobN